MGQCRPVRLKAYFARKGATAYGTSEFRACRIHIHLHGYKVVKARKTNIGQMLWQTPLRTSTRLLLQGVLPTHFTPFLEDLSLPQPSEYISITWWDNKDNCYCHYTSHPATIATTSSSNVYHKILVIYSENPLKALRCPYFILIFLLLL